MRVSEPATAQLPPSMFLVAKHPLVTQESDQGCWASAEAPLKTARIVSKGISVSAQSAPEAHRKRGGLRLCADFFRCESRFFLSSKMGSAPVLLVVAAFSYDGV